MNTLSAPENVFPVDALPLLMREALNDIMQATKTAPPLAAGAILATSAIACQHSIDVMLPIGQVRPVSLNVLTFGQSGDRKTAVDILVSKPLRAVDEDREVTFRRDTAKFEAELEVWAALNRGRLKKLKNATNKEAGHDGK